MIAFLILVFTALNSPYIWPYPIFQFFALGVGLAIGGWMTFQRRALVLNNNNLLPLALVGLICAAAASTAFADGPAYRLFQLLAYMCAFYFIHIYVCRSTLIGQIQISGWLLMAAILAALLSGIQLMNRNILASVLVLHLPIGGEMTERRDRVIWWVLGLAAMLATGSRSGLLGLAVMIAVMKGIDWRKIGLIFFVALPGLIMLRPDTALIRFCYWRAAVVAWLSSPILGIGPGAFESWARGQGCGYCPHAHNLILTILAEMGVIGLGALLFLLWQIWRARRPGPEWAALCGFAMMSVFDDPIWLYAPGLGVMSILAIMMKGEK